LGTDDLVAIRDAGGNHYYVTQDRLHSVRGLAKQSDGSCVRSIRYGPYLGLAPHPALLDRLPG
jgi:hypothetical protein